MTELDKRREYTVTKGGVVVATGTTGANGTIAFSDHPNGAATYAVALGNSTAVHESRAALIPRTIEMKNYPNPFSPHMRGIFNNPSTTIAFTLPKSGQATLAIYNTAGQLVRRLIADTLAGGTHQIIWDATNDDGARVASGLYLGRLEFGGSVSQVKLVLAK